MSKTQVIMMESEKTEDQMPNDSMTAQNVAPGEGVESGDNFPSELLEPIWSVVTYETVAASGLTYEEAAKLAENLKKERVSGICIITDQAAHRISN